VVDDFVHSFVNDCRFYSCLDGLHKINKKIGEPTDEHVGKQNGLELRKSYITKVCL